MEKKERKLVRHVTHDNKATVQLPSVWGLFSVTPGHQAMGESAITVLLDGNSFISHVSAAVMRLNSFLCCLGSKVSHGVALWFNDWKVQHFSINATPGVSRKHPPTAGMMFISLCPETTPNIPLA